MNCTLCGHINPERAKFCLECGKPFAPALCEWAAELATALGDDVARMDLLREVHRLYGEIGAPRHAQRIARERAA